MSTGNVSGGAEGGLTNFGRSAILATAFLGWLCAGVQMSITPLVSRSATVEMLWPGQQQSQSLSDAQKEIVTKWFAWFNAAFLFGAAAGGMLFGWMGDRSGRAKAMGLSILCYSLMSGAGYFARTTEQLLVLRFLGCLGVGGMWPNGISLVSEAWPKVSRPVLAGVIGTAANVGLVLVGLLACYVKITPDSWRWIMLLGATPAILGVFVFVSVPESPRWLAGRLTGSDAPRATPLTEIFQSPLLRVTIIGICLGTIPLLGGWGSGNWLVPWADEVGALKDPHLKAWTQVQRSTGGAISSLLGGWLAGFLGRKRSYFLISLGSLGISYYLFNYLTPLSSHFALCAFMLGFISGFYFGWLPLCLPELFPTRVRSTGAGVTFNFGRIAAAIGVLSSTALVHHYGGHYGKVGSITSLVYALGMVVIWFAPDTTQQGLAD